MPIPSNYDPGCKRVRRRAASVIFILSPRCQLVRSTGTGGAEKQFASVRKSKIPAVGTARPVLRLVPIDHDLGARQQGVLGESAPEQDIRRARFDCPVYHRAVGAL